MTIQKEFIVRYLDADHVRFQIPQRAAAKQIASLLTKRILLIDGVKAVRLFESQKKLSIRFNAAVCNFRSLANQLFQIIAELDREGHFAPVAISHSSSKRKRPGFFKKSLRNSRVGRWLDRRYRDMKETVTAAKIISKISTKGPKALIKDPEKATIDFLNDILVLYLIKVHWTRITQKWLVRPLTYRYEWLAMFYLFFLLVRSRRKK